MVLMVPMAHKAFRARQVRLGHKARREIQVPRAPQAQLGLRLHTNGRARRYDLRTQMELMEATPILLVQLALLVRKDHKEIRGLRAQRARLEQLERRAQLVRLALLAQHQNMRGLVTV